MIRKLDEKDIERVMEIWKSSTIKGHSFIEEAYWEKNYEIVKNTYIPMSETFLWDEGEIKGFVSIIDKNFIGALFVDVNYQGIGIGSKLIDYVSIKYGTLALAVYKKNENAIKFYETKGFKKIKEEKNEETGESEYVMEKSIL